MNKIIKVLFLTAALFVMNGLVSAQTVKIAHVNTNEILADMPERTKAEKTLESYGNELQEQLNTMLGEYQNKLQDYQANAESMSNLVRQSKEKELVDLESRITAFQNNAETEFAKKQQDLFTPLLEKVQNAINAVGKEKGYTYILDVNPAVGTVAYIGADAIDITKDVKAKLGIKK
jgi:Outer membrane protein